MGNLWDACPYKASSGGSKGGANLRPQIFSISCSFLEKFGNIVGWRPLLEGWRPLLRGILDPPLARGEVGGVNKWMGCFNKVHRVQGKSPGRDLVQTNIFWLSRFLLGKLSMFGLGDSFPGLALHRQSDCPHNKTSTLLWLQVVVTSLPCPRKKTQHVSLKKS